MSSILIGQRRSIWKGGRGILIKYGRDTEMCQGGQTRKEGPEIRQYEEVQTDANGQSNDQEKDRWSDGEDHRQRLFWEIWLQEQV